MAIAIPARSQVKYDFNWIIGFGNEGTLINFANDNVTVTSVIKDMYMHADSGTMSDEDGNLLFYTNGCYVANKEHDKMVNGNGLNPGSIHTDFCSSGYPMSQGILIFPSLVNEYEYYLVHERLYNPDPFHSDILYYSLIDMEAQNGLGEVTEKNVPILEDSLWAGYLTATKHANNVDWWIISAEGFTNKYFKILFSADGFEVVDKQEAGLPLDFASAGGQAVFSPDGTKYVWYDQIRNVMLFDFDRSTGQLEYQQQLHVADTIYFGGAAISPNNRFLYISNAIYLYQYDLEAPDIQASKVLVGAFDGFNSPFPANFFLMQLGPDCRIYMSTGNGTDRLHVINSPNEKGVDCDFRQHAIQLPKDNFSTLPNNPNYRLGTGYPVCDPTIQLVTSSVQILSQPWEVSVFPNPASGQVTVEVPHPLASESVWSLHNAVGQRVLVQKMKPGAASETIPLTGVPPGLYFWEMGNKEGSRGSGKLIIVP